MGLSHFLIFLRGIGTARHTVHTKESTSLVEVHLLDLIGSHGGAETEKRMDIDEISDSKALKKGQIGHGVEPVVEISAEVRVFVLEHLIKRLLEGSIDRGLLFFGSLSGTEVSQIMDDIFDSLLLRLGRVLVLSGRESHERDIPSTFFFAIVLVVQALRIFLDGSLNELALFSDFLFTLDNSTIM